jgi:carbohydrate diacid regulator
VTDDRDLIIAGSDVRMIGLSSRQAGGMLQPESLRVPLHLDAWAGEVIVAQPQNGEALSPHLVQVILDLMVSNTVVSQLPNRQELKSKFLHDVLHGTVADEATILCEAKGLGLDLVPPRVVILIDAADFILGPEDAAGKRAAPVRSAERQAQLLIGSIVNFFTLPNDTICAHLGGGEIAVLKASNTRNLAAWVEGGAGQDEGASSWANLDALRRASTALLARLRADTGAAISIGIGRHHPGLHGLARSFEDARAALSLGRCLQGPNGVHSLDRLGVAGFVGIDDEATKADLARHLLSPLDHEPDLLTTLEDYYAENCTPGPTASRIGIHRNTLGYRLDKIASLTGLDPRRFDEALQIRLALVIRALHTRRGT